LNKLEKETSPYLLEHKHNPVKWYAWNNATLVKAKKEEKPILLSIGYSACHWCHVMAKESFENKEIATLMNKNFINIKVDREERPDLDIIYQNALHVFGEQGGWPLTMFLTPKLEPFWGGTYFPPIEKFGRPAFPTVLKTISEVYKKEKDKIKKSINLIKDGIKKNTKNIYGNDINENLSKQVSLSLIDLIDKKKGGIKGAPKFPNVPIFENILRFSLKNSSNKENLLITSGIYQTLEKICLGGIYDHIGGGFSRYSTDEDWLVPHFEKMLYDNAQLIELLIYGYQIFQEPIFKNRIFKTIEWVLNEMKTKDGGLASAIDADSEGEEGKYYTWEKKEITKILKKQSEKFCERFNVTNDGNWEGKNILNLKRKEKIYEIEENEKLLNLLFFERKKRIKPNLDNKILTDSNGLMINALANAGWVFNKKEWLKEAENIYLFIFQNLMVENELYHSWKDNNVKTFAILDDYANLIRCSITLFEKTNKEKYLINAINLSKKVIKNFKDEKKEGFYITSNKTTDVFTKLKSIYDNATPSGVSLIIQSFAKIYFLTGDVFYYNEAKNTLKSISGNILKNFFSSASLINANDLLEDGTHLIFLKSSKDSDKSFINKIKSLCLPNIIFQEIENSKKLNKRHPIYGKKCKNEKHTVYLCKNQICSLPVISFNELIKNLKLKKWNKK
tara:strand:- start:1172 stop:3199 length:2028 start_codon:yes stop_codon:yes gene_type:complete